ncbi:MAG: SCO family protein [Bacteroidetes bacterium]|nr:SCO family protein [Bacteroidota bacterium]
MAENQKPTSGIRKAIYLLLVILLPATIYFIMTTGKHNMLSLPVYGNKDVSVAIVDGKEVSDTIYHTLPAFSFTNQYGETVSSTDFKGKIMVANFFFTTCPTICPKMTSGLVHAREKLKDYPQVIFLSHTVDPETDTVEALAAYAKKARADEGWHFVTGEKEEIYRQAVIGFMVGAQEDVLAPGGFLHSEQIVLVDKSGRIRGYYDGTELQELNRLIDEVKVLIASEMIPRKNKK